MITLLSYFYLSGRYSHFAKQLMACNFGVYAMDWIGVYVFVLVFLFVTVVFP